MRWIEEGKIPAAIGLWWLLLPLLAFATWRYLRDGRMKPSAPTSPRGCPHEAVPENP
jgi:hypothetical protein